MGVTAPQSMTGQPLGIEGTEESEPLDIEGTDEMSKHLQLHMDQSNKESATRIR